jgi:signal transduction histidine kinase
MADEEMVAPQVQHGNFQLLVVDDEDVTRYATAKVLRRAGFHVQEAASGQEALDLVEPPDAIVLDVRLPDIDGFEVCRRLREREGMEDIPVLHVSAAYVDDHDRIRGLRAGADAYLTHPVDPDVIVATVETLLRARDTQRRLRVLEQERHQETDRSRDLFLGVLGHDLRNPLNAMLMSAQALMLRDGMEADALKLCARIVRSGQRMKGMLDDLHDLAHTKLGAGLLVHRRETGLAAIVGEAVEELTAVYPGADLTLETDDELVGLWDPDRIARLASNLVRNAIQYGAKDQAVTVSLRAVEGAAEMRVHNHGEPIAPQAMAQLFDPMMRGADSQHDGTNLGLGLFICQQIAQAHGGSITCESEAASGTTFVVSLPMGT